MFFRDVTDTNQSESHSGHQQLRFTRWGLGGPEEDHQLHHCCWTGSVGEREEEEEDLTDVWFYRRIMIQKIHKLYLYLFISKITKPHTLDIREIAEQNYMYRFIES